MAIERKLVAEIAAGTFKKTSLDLSGKKLKDEDIAELIAALEYCPTLIALDLTGNELTDVSAKLLAKNTTLRTLKLREGNPITTTGLSAFLENDTLTSFPFRGGSGKVVSDLREHIKNNKDKPPKKNPTKPKVVVEEPPTTKEQGPAEKPYLERPVTSKTKTGEDNFQQLLFCLLRDLEDFESELDYVIWYTAIVLNLYMHNSSHRPQTGYGKVQARERDHALQYYRSQMDHPHRMVHDRLAKRKGDSLRSYLPRNQAFEGVVENTQVSTELQNDFSKLDKRGFKKTNKAKLRNYFGTFLAHSGARANNHTVYQYALREITQFENQDVTADEGIACLVKKLSSKEFQSKPVSKKIKKLDSATLSARIKVLHKQFKTWDKNPDADGHVIGLYGTMFSHRNQAAKTMRDKSRDLKLKQLAVSTPASSTCVYIELYPEFTNQSLRNSNNYNEGFTNLMIGFLGGLLNHHAERRGLFIHTDRRQSFGFFRPTLTDVGSMRIRLSLGLEPEVYNEVVSDSLRDLDKLLKEFDFTDRENPKVKACFEACHNPKGEEATDRTGNRMLAAMGSDNDKWLALSQAQYYLGQEATLSKAFQQYLAEFIIGRKVVEAKTVVKDPKRHTAKERHAANNFNASPVFAILNNLVNYAAEFTKQLPELTDDGEALDFKQSYWHSLTKLYSNCNKAIDLLAHVDDFEVTHMYAKANLLVENILEYLIALDTLKQILEQDQEVDSDPVATLVTTERDYVARSFGLDEGQVGVYFADSGQQAITASILAMDMELVETEVQSDYCDHTVFVHDKSYFELVSFLDEVDTLKTENKKSAKIVFVDITALGDVKLEQFPKLSALVIDITNYSDVNQAKLRATIKALHEKNIWVVLVSSSLKHDELSLDKYQSGKIVTLAPPGEELCENVVDELQSISDEAMPRSVAAYLQIVNQVYQDKVSPPAKKQQPVAQAEQIKRLAPIIAKFGIMPEKQVPKLNPESAPGPRATSGLAR